MIVDSVCNEWRVEINKRKTDKLFIWFITWNILAIKIWIMLSFSGLTFLNKEVKSNLFNMFSFTNIL